jgi:hypothetical protein
MKKSVSFGTCQLCSERKSKAAMVGHLKRCLPVSSASDDSSSQVLLLRVQGGARMYWLDLMASPDVELRDIDRLLRHIWLECCGHLSEFYAGAHRKITMSTKVGEVFGSISNRLGYTYDFGSSTELVVSLSGFAEAGSGDPVRIVARNEPPIWPCDACGQAATGVCVQCAYEGGFCCAEHGDSHDCGEEMLLPVVNSPRMGVCGYTG